MKRAMTLESSSEAQKIPEIFFDEQPSEKQREGGDESGNAGMKHAC